MSHMLAAISPWLSTLRDTSAVVGALAACLVAVHAASKVPFVSIPVRWVGRTFFANPVESWLDRLISRHLEPVTEEIAKLKHEVMPNGGTSMRDAIDRLEAEVCQAEGPVESG